VATDNFNGTFSIANVPAGSVTLMYVEPSGQDAFSFASRRSVVNVRVTSRVLDSNSSTTGRTCRAIAAVEEPELRHLGAALRERPGRIHIVP